MFVCSNRVDVKTIVRKPDLFNTHVLSRPVVVAQKDARAAPLNITQRKAMAELAAKACQ